MKPSDLFSKSDEREFKKNFVIQFLAAHDAVDFSDNCRRGWKSHKPAVEDAEFLASKAWEEWVSVIGTSS